MKTITMRRLFTIALLIATMAAADAQWALPSARAAPAKKALLLFDCGPGQTADGYTQLLPSTAFTEKLGYGFEDISKVDSRTGDKPDALRGDLCLPGGTSFLVNLPDDDYEVTILSGDMNTASSLSVEAEGRRAADLASAAGSFDQRSFPVRVRDG